MAIRRRSVRRPCCCRPIDSSHDPNSPQWEPFNSSLNEAYVSRTGADRERHPGSCSVYRGVAVSNWTAIYVQSEPINGSRGLAMKSSNKDKARLTARDHR